MKIIITLISAFITLSSSYGQTVTDYLDGIPVVSHPKTFNESSYYNWTGYDLPASISTLPKFTGYKTIAKIELDANYPLLLIRKYYNNGFDRTMSLVSFDAAGNYIGDLDGEYTADGEGGDFSITPEGKIRVVNHGAMTAIIKTYHYENGLFIEEGTPEETELDVLPDY